ncbi:MAG: MFS transporter [Niastella sp.]|nr:MFS transporter [Niastella sp.]
MRRIKESRVGFNTIVALGLIPLSGFAMDIFIPSLPDMAVKLHTTPAAIQLTLSLFIITYGIAQLIVGGLIDSFGRYWPNLISMLVFSAASFTIAYTTNLQLIYGMRILQGITVAVIVVSKRAFFVDVYAGDQLKKYTSMFSVIWAIAPIVAPFLGGYFQTTWGWSSNFVFLGYFGLFFFVIEVFTGGESMKAAQPFSPRQIVKTYGHMIKTPDFTAGMVILGLSYAMLLVYGMCSPFLIEERLGFSAAVTGYCSLFSGVAVFVGGSISRMLIKKPFLKKLLMASTFQLVTVAILIPVALYFQHIVTLMVFVFLLHSLAGFIFNNLMSYCLTRFPQFAGKASGLTGGGFSVVTAVFSSILANTITITTQAMLGVAYGVLTLGVMLLLLKTKWQGSGVKKEDETITQQKAAVAA